MTFACFGAVFVCDVYMAVVAKEAVTSLGERLPSTLHISFEEEGIMTPPSTPKSPQQERSGVMLGAQDNHNTLRKNSTNASDPQVFGHTASISGGGGLCITFLGET